MDTFEFDTLTAEQQASGKLYLEFLRVPSLSVGVYNLPAGSADPQQPHNEDEVYHVVNGRGMIRAGEEDRPVEPGTVVFVGAHVPHHFHTITADLQLLVFFAPPEGSR